MHTKKWRWLVASALVFASAGLGRARAGIIIDGTDANDHGGVSGGVNQAGWEYMQRALTALAPTTAPEAARVLAVLGTSGGIAGDAIDSAFARSGLTASGWTILHVDGAAAIATYLASLSTSNTGIAYLPTYGHTGGDLTAAEMAAINAGASQIEAFTRAGGSLFAMGETGVGAYGWLQTLIPGIVVADVGAGGFASNITLTPEGMAAFPGLTNADLAGADPWHEHFSGDLGGLLVLGTAPQGNFTRNVILGNVGGSIVQPAVPEPSGVAMMGVGGLGLLGYARRKRGRRGASR